MRTRKRPSAAYRSASRPPVTAAPRRSSACTTLHPAHATIAPLASVSLPLTALTASPHELLTASHALCVQDRKN